MAQFDVHRNPGPHDVFLHPLEMVSVPSSRLGEAMATLASEADRIIAAIDVVISRAWR